MTGDAWDYQIVFDGGSLGNPGKGYGSYRWRRSGQDWEEPVSLEYGPNVTNNEAEYRSLLAGLEGLYEAIEAPESVTVEILGDSQLVIRQLKGEWRVKAENLKPFVNTARRLASRFGRVRYRWHRRDKSVELLGH